MIRLILKVFLVLSFGFMCFSLGAALNQKGSGDWSMDVTPGMFDGIKLEDGTIIAPDELPEYYRGD